MVVEYGVPTWTTEARITRRSVLDDLGLEGVGAGILGRLLPGIDQKRLSMPAIIYPYLLARWEDWQTSIDGAEAKAVASPERGWLRGCVRPTRPPRLAWGRRGISAVAKQSKLVPAPSMSLDYAWVTAEVGIQEPLRRLQRGHGQ